MTHEIDVSSPSAHMEYAGIVPWQGLGIRVPENTAPSEAAAAAGLDWRALCATVMIDYPDEMPRSAGATTKLVREDILQDGAYEKAVIATVPNGYQPVQNSEILSILDSLTSESGFRFDSAGTLGKGERSWFMIKLAEEMEVAKNDPIEMYLVLVNCFDLQRIEVRLTSSRMFCSNTLSYPFEDEDGISFNIPHVMPVDDRMRIMEMYIARFRDDSLALISEFQKMASTSISKDQLNAMITAAFPSPRGRKSLSQNIRIGNARRYSKLLFESGAGNEIPEVAGTVWAALNGITEYLDHHGGVEYLKYRWTTNGDKLDSEVDHLDIFDEPSESIDQPFCWKDPDTRLESIWFGEGYHAKLRAMEFAKKLVDEAAGSTVFDTDGVNECSSDQALCLALM